MRVLVDGGRFFVIQDIGKEVFPPNQVDLQIK